MRLGSTNHEAEKYCLPFGKTVYNFLQITKFRREAVSRSGSFRVFVLRIIRRTLGQD
jgi:hypothetical protein